MNRLAPTVAAAVAGCAVLTGCGALHHATERATPTPTVPTAPPAAASQPPGPPLATASAAPSGPVDRRSATSVAADCYRRWQSYDSRTDEPTSALARTKACFTDDLYQSLSAGSAVDNAQATKGWLQQRAAGTRSTAEIIGTPDRISGATDAGRVVLLLHVRHVIATNAGPVAAGGGVETPALTMVRQADGSWRIAGVDRSTDYGNAPGA